MHYRCNEENKRKRRQDGRVTQVELPPGYGVIMSPVRRRFRARPRPIYPTSYPTSVWSRERKANHSRRRRRHRRATLEEREKRGEM